MAVRSAVLTFHRNTQTDTQTDRQHYYYYDAEYESFLKQVYRTGVLEPTLAEAQIAPGKQKNTAAELWPQNMEAVRHLEL